jgi:ketosteroid isomerase-like protein
MSRANEELARDAFEALFRWQWEAWRASFDPDVIYIPTKEWPDSAPRRGPQEIERFMRGIQQDWEDWDMSIRDVRGNGDRVLVETRVNAVGATSGIELRGRTFHVVTFRDGLITHMQDFIEKDEALAASGLAT